MKYQEWKAEQQAQLKKEKNQRLFDIGLYEIKEYKKLPDIEILDDSTKLVYFKKGEEYGFYEELIENDSVYGFKLYMIETLTEEQYIDITSKIKRNNYGLIGAVLEGTGWFLAVGSLILYFVLFFTGLSTGYDFLGAMFYSGSYFAAFVISILIIAIGRYFKCKDIS
ncbi:hypothetical protein LJC17_03755 [Acholeplasma sp. OttesenSCG-928-E16]|nr:hypothetical protein [Acholeplasma sp. OttesenSCG-928-E16]